MAIIVRTPSGTWKAVVRKQGWRIAAKTFRTKRDAEDRLRRAEDQMVRGFYIQRSPSGRMLLSAALDRYLDEVTLAKKASTQRVEKLKANPLRKFFGKYAIAAIDSELVATCRDQRLATISQRIIKATRRTSLLRPRQSDWSWLLSHNLHYGHPGGDLAWPRILFRMDASRSRQKDVTGGW